MASATKPTFLRRAHEPGFQETHAAYEHGRSRRAGAGRLLPCGAGRAVDAVVPIAGAGRAAKARGGAAQGPAACSAQRGAAANAATTSRDPGRTATARSATDPAGSPSGGRA